MYILNTVDDQGESMLVAAAIVLTLTAIGGLAAAGLRARSGANPPMPIALVHGGVGAVGLLLVIIAGVSNGFSDRHTLATVLLIVAALGGFLLFGTHLRERLISLPVILIHALVAVVGYVTLLLEAVS